MNCQPPFSWISDSVEEETTAFESWETHRLEWIISWSDWRMLPLKWSARQWQGQEESIKSSTSCHILFNILLALHTTWICSLILMYFPWKCLCAKGLIESLKLYQISNIWSYLSILPNKHRKHAYWSRWFPNSKHDFGNTSLTWKLFSFWEMSIFFMITVQMWFYTQFQFHMICTDVV